MRSILELCHFQKTLHQLNESGFWKWAMLSPTFKVSWWLGQWRYCWWFYTYPCVVVLNIVLELVVLQGNSWKELKCTPCMILLKNNTWWTSQGLRFQVVGCVLSATIFPIKHWVMCLILWIFKCAKWPKRGLKNYPADLKHFKSILRD